jgi:hypothetical protein
MNGFGSDSIKETCRIRLISEGIMKEIRDIEFVMINKVDQGSHYIPYRYYSSSMSDWNDSLNLEDVR